ncbi:hypothetical protein AAC387_Pa09g0475 [Persea americana]
MMFWYCETLDDDRRFSGGKLPIIDEISPLVDQLLCFLLMEKAFKLQCSRIYFSISDDNYDEPKMEEQKGVLRCHRNEGEWTT